MSPEAGAAAEVGTGHLSGGDTSQARLAPPFGEAPHGPSGR